RGDRLRSDLGRGGGFLSCGRRDRHFGRRLRRRGIRLHDRRRVHIRDNGGRLGGRLRRRLDPHLGHGGRVLRRRRDARPGHRPRGRLRHVGGGVRLGGRREGGGRVLRRRGGRVGRGGGVLVHGGAAVGYHLASFT